MIAIVHPGLLLATSIDTTVPIYNPDRPPKLLCAQFAEDPDAPVGESCDEPAAIERDAGTLIQDLLNDYFWIGFVAPL